MIMPPETIAEALRTASTTGAVGVALPERTIGTGFWTACRALERQCYLDDPLLHNPRLIRREILTGGGGFALSMSGPEDADLRLRMRAAGARIELAPVLVDHDEGRLTIRSVMEKRYYYGRSLPAFADSHEGEVARQGLTVARSYLRNWRLLAHHPLQSVGMLGAAWPRGRRLCHGRPQGPSGQSRRPGIHQRVNRAHRSHGVTPSRHAT